MITLKERLSLLERLGEYLRDDKEWSEVKNKARQENGWFTESFTDLAVSNIITEFLDAGKLKEWIKDYDVPEIRSNPKLLGIVMAGNIPLVGFHEFLCGFVSGHNMLIKRSSKDGVLITHIVDQLAKWDERTNETVVFSEQLKKCDAYIATGSNNTGRYFEYYFKNYANIIRKNRTSVAVLTGKETADELDKLSDDLLLYFGLGCRSVSKIYAPASYNFEPLLNALNKYKWMEDHQKLKNNYDYNLSLLLLNHQYYMTNGTVLLVENEGLFSPISQVHYEYYDTTIPDDLLTKYSDKIQCVIGSDYTRFGKAQSPALSDYADGVDTMQFLSGIN